MRDNRNDRPTFASPRRAATIPRCQKATFLVGADYIRARPAKDRRPAALHHSRRVSPALPTSAIDLRRDPRSKALALCHDCARV